MACAWQSALHRVVVLPDDVLPTNAIIPPGFCTRPCASSSTSVAYDAASSALTRGAEDTEVAENAHRSLS